MGQPKGDRLPEQKIRGQKLGRKVENIFLGRRGNREFWKLREAGLTEET
jgi:hypothetical protein